MILAAYLVPHPPLIFPEVGRGKQFEIQSTIDSYRSVSKEIAAMNPDTVVIVSPHAAMYADYFHISPGRSATGDMRQFGVSARELSVSAEYDARFAETLALVCRERDFPAGPQGERDKHLDHGTMIPVRFILEAAESTIRFVRAGVSGLSAEDHYRFGMLIRETSERLDLRTVVVASGDLSHKLKDEGPYGYSPEGPQFDQMILQVVNGADFLKLLELGPDFCEKAGECGHRPLAVMAGALDGAAVKATLCSYEGPFGVGYGVGSFLVSEAHEGETGKTGKTERKERRFLEQYLERERARAEERRSGESPHVRLARNTVENFVRTRRMYESPEPLPPKLAEGRAGVFVSIKKHGALRGCIGTISPVTENIGEEIRHNAVSAATQDSRFDPITPDELPYLAITVDVLMPSESAASAEMLDPKRYGVMVSLGGKRGLLLPDLEGIDDAETQIRIAMQKAGIPERDRPRVKLERFEVVRYC
jgi:AmmeMemoRadiSam system protein A